MLSTHARANMSSGGLASFAGLLLRIRMRRPVEAEKQEKEEVQDESQVYGEGTGLKRVFFFNNNIMRNEMIVFINNS